MNDEHAQIDWDAARRQLHEAETALESALSADAETIDRVYRERATQMARRHTESTGNLQATKVLVFGLGLETYGIPVADLAEVLPSTRCTPVPRAAAEVAGVINLRGELRSVIDLRRLLSLPGDEDASAGCILMLRNGRDEVGLKVGPVEKVQAIREDELMAPELGALEGSSSYVKGLSRDKVIVLDPDALRAHPVFGNSR